MLSNTVTSGSVYPTLRSLLLMLTLLYVHLFAFSLFDIEAVMTSSKVYRPCQAACHNITSLECSRVIQLF